jgi:DNA-binding transcriptional LysR family regulator
MAASRDTDDRIMKAVEARPAALGLPPAQLLALQAFEAAFRLGSFRAAAESLHLTPSAVSHRIRSLEALIGDPLFTRAHRAVTPTLAGRTLAGATGRAFTELGRAMARKDAAPAKARLRVAVARSFETAWLIPRLAGFLEAHPSIELVVEGVNRRIDFDNEPFDVAISPGAGEWPGLAAQALLRIFTVPVCSPALARSLRLTSPADLRRATLIQVTPYPLAWPLWFEHAGVAEVRPRGALWLDSFGAAQQAAELGLGVAMGLEVLLGASEAAGRLMRPFPVLNRTGDLWLLHRPLDARNPALRVFKAWIAGEAHATEAGELG